MEKPRSSGAPRHEAQGGPETAPPITSISMRKVNSENAEAKGTSSQSEGMLGDIASDDAQVEEETVPEARPARNGRGRNKLVGGDARDTNFLKVGRGARPKPRSTASMINVAPQLASNRRRHAGLDDAR